MKTETIVCAALAALLAVPQGVFAAENADGKSAGEKEARRLRLEKRFGGFANRPAVGKLGIYDCQTKLDWIFIQIKATQLGKSLNNLNVRAEKADAPKPGTFPTRPADANAAIFIVDDPAFPMSLAAPEARWGLVNVAALAADKPDAERLKDRFAKELCRVTASALGGWMSGMAGMTTVTTLEELDAIKGDGLSTDVSVNVSRNLAKLGMTPPHHAPYSRACHEGWAPPPTNEWQKAIWDKAHELPSKPMKIKYDPKKGE